MTQRQKGALYMILSALCFASMQVVVRLSREIPTMEQIFMRNSFVLIVSAIIILRKKGSLFGPAKYQPYLFGRSFFGFLGLITLFYASSHAAQGDVTILNKNFPYLGHHSGRHLYERKAAQDPDPGAGTFHGGCLHRVPPQL